MKRIFSCLALALCTAVINPLYATDDAPYVNYSSNYNYDEIRVVYPVLMTEFGQAIATAPAKDQLPQLTPTGDCQWEWRSSRELTCVLDRDHRLKRSSRYLLSVPTMKAPSGQQFEAISHPFETPRPTLMSGEVSWRSANEGDLLIRFSAAVDLVSLRQNAYLLDQQTKQRWSLTTLTPTNAESEKEFTAPLPSGLMGGAAYALGLGENIMPLEGELPLVAVERADTVLTLGAFQFLGISCASQARYQTQFTEPTAKPKCNPAEGADFWFTEQPSEAAREQLKSAFKARNEWTFNTTRTDPHSGLKQRVAAVRLNGLASDESFDVNLTELDDIWGRTLGNQRMRLRTEEWAASLVIGKLPEKISSTAAVNLSLRSINVKRLLLKLEQVTGDGLVRNERRIDVPDFQQDTWQDWSLNLKPYLKSGGSLIRGSVETPGGKASARFSINVSDTEFIVRRNGNSLLVWALNSATNEPQRGANLQLLNGWQVNKRYAVTKTDAAGFAQLALPVDQDQESERHVKYDRWWLRLTQNNATAIQPLQTDWYNAEWESADRHAGILPSNTGDTLIWGITDKHLYSPGEVLNYQFFARRKGQDRLNCVDKKSGYHLAVFDEDQTILLEQGPLTLDARCAASGKLDLPQTLSHGLYHIIVRDRAVTTDDFDDDVRDNSTPFRGRVLFEIANPRPPAVNVTMVANRTPWLTWQGPLEITTSAQYFSGGPQLGATLKLDGSYFLANSNYYSTDPRQHKYPGYTFEVFDAEKRMDLQEKETNIIDERLADIHGELKTTIKPPLWLPGYSRFNADGSSKGRDKQSAEGWMESIPVFFNTQFVGLKLRSWYPKVGKPLNTQLLVLNQQFDVKKGAPIRLTLYRHGATSGNAYDNEDKILRAEEVSHCDCLSTVQPISCDITPTEPGSYELVASITDGNQRHHEASEWLRVYPDSRWSWDDNDDPELRLSADKNEYVVGETAQLQLSQPFSQGRALLTVERDGVLTSSWLALTDTEMQIEVPITAAMQNGASVRVLLKPVITSKQQHELAVGVALNIKTAAPPTLQLATEKTRYRPGDNVTATVRLPEAGRHGLVLTAVDSALLKLMFDADSYFNPDNKDFLQTFRTWKISSEVDSSGWISAVAEADKAQFGRVVAAQSSSNAVSRRRADIFYEGDDEQRIEVTGSRISRTDLIGPATDGNAVLPKSSAKKAERWRARVRQEFRQTAHWLAQAETDATGKATVQFTLPDNLTSWTILATSYDADQDFRFGKTEFAAQLPIEARITGPEHSVMGDRIGISAVIRNAESKNKTISAKLTVKTDAAPTEQTKTASVRQAAFAESLLTDQLDTAPINAEATTARWLVQAQDGDGEDAVSGDVWVRAPVVNKRLQSSLLVAADSPTELKFSLPPDAFDASASLRWQGLSLLSGVAETVDYMHNYPHRCWEQRTSRTWSAVQGARLLATESSQPAAASARDTLLNDWIKQSVAFQAPNGGFSYWRGENDYVDLALSSYTARALAAFHQLGWQGGVDVQQRLQEYLNRQLAALNAGKLTLSNTERASLLAAISASDLVPEQLAALQQKRPQLSNEALIWLLEAQQRHRAPAVQITATRTELTRRGFERAGMVELRHDDDANQWHWLGSSQRSQCLAVSALLHSAKTKADVAEAYSWLRAAQVQRQHSGEFGNTQENAYCLQAVAELATQGVSRKTTGAMTVATSSSDRLQLQNSPVAFPLQAENTVRLQAAGNESEWLDVSVNYRADARRDGERQQGMSLRREYEVFRNNRWQIAGTDTLQVGDWVRVTLTIQTSGSYPYIAVSDPLPGAMVAVDPEHDATVPVQTLGELDTSYSFYEKQFRDGYARFYADHLYAGNFRIQYFAKVITHGQYQALPAKIEAMYDSTRFATSRNNMFEIEAPK